MEVLFSERYITLSYVKEKNCMVQSWLSFCNTEQFRQAQNKTVELFLKNKCQNLISDTSKAGLLKKEDVEWATKFITPQLLEGGMKNFYMVVPSSAFTQLTVKNLEQMEKENHQDLLKFFPNLNSALSKL